LSLRTLHLLGSPILRERSSEVAEVNDEIRALVEDLFDTMRAENGIGLAANQVGVTRRVAVVDTGEGDAIVLINPVILERHGKDRAEEGCLSIPELYGDVDRAEEIVLETTTQEGERVRLELSALCSRAVQHEIDHLDGILFLDYLSPLKRRMLVKKWKKSRKGQTGYLKEVSPVSVKG
jgi:peptide deformylase